MRQAREFSETALKEALIPLGAYLGEVVLCGSWVPFVYRRWMLGKREGKGTVRTLDIDLAAPSPLPLLGRPLADQLRGAGYRVMRRPDRPLWDMEGDAGPQVTHFERPDAPYLELITAHRGTGPQGGVREIQEGERIPTGTRYWRRWTRGGRRCLRSLQFPGPLHHSPRTTLLHHNKVAF